jgi:hypothetical protein
MGNKPLLLALLCISIRATFQFHPHTLTPCNSHAITSSLRCTTKQDELESTSTQLSDVDRKVLEKLLESSPSLKSDAAVQELLKSQPPRRRPSSPSGQFQSGLLNNLELWKNEQSAKMDEAAARAALGLYNAIEQAVSAVFQIIDERLGDGSRALKGNSGRGLKMLAQGVKDEVRKGGGGGGASTP